MRSATSRPAARRSAWTALTTSRARPSRASSGVTVVSRATARRSAAATTTPGRGVRATTTSSTSDRASSARPHSGSAVTRADAATAASSQAPRSPRRPRLHARPEAGAEPAVVGLGAQVGVGPLVLAGGHRLDVQLFGDEVGVGVDRSPHRGVVADHGQRRAAAGAPGRRGPGAGRGPGRPRDRTTAMSASRAPVDQGRVGLRVVAVVDAGGDGGAGFRLLHHQLLVEGLGHEREHRGHHLGEGDQHLVEGGEGGQGVGGGGRAAGVALAPEAAPRAADVPVGEVVDEGDQRGDHVVEVVALHLVVHPRDQALQHRQDPAVDLGALRRRRRRGEVGGPEAVGGGVGGEEARRRSRAGASRCAPPRAPPPR